MAMTDAMWTPWEKYEQVARETVREVELGLLPPVAFGIHDGPCPWCDHCHGCDRAIPRAQRDDGPGALCYACEYPYESPCEDERE
jgi:hypothetical protein